MSTFASKIFVILSIFCYHGFMKYTTVLFDADDTLFDFYHTGQKSFIKAFTDLGIGADESDYDIYSEINQKRWDLYSVGKMTKHDVVIGRFEEYSAAKGLKFDINAFYELYEDNLSKTAILLPETVSTLKTLQNLGVRMFLITNGLSTVQRGRLAISGIADYFDDVFISDEIGHNKPSKEYFDYISEKIPDLNKNKTLIVGDSLVSDIALGINNGIDTCLFGRNNADIQTEAKPTYKVSEMSKVIEIVKGK